jgi:quinol monooxygenase YgiN
VIDATVFELRQYLLQPNTRDDFIAHFEQHLIEPQQAAGMLLVGLFRDRDRPDVFVWIRGFAGMAARARALESFYLGPVWAEHRDVMNSMMIDSDDVLLLRPHEPAPFAAAAAPGGVRVRIWATSPVELGSTVSRYREQLAPRLPGAGEQVVAELHTETAANTFPRLPVRDDIFAFVVVTALSTSDWSDLDGLRPVPVQTLTLY